MKGFRFFANLISILFIFGSGAKPHKLNGKEDDRMDFKWQGALVLTISLLATLSGGHAISIVFHSPAVYIPAGLLWGIIFLQIERMVLEHIRVSIANSNDKKSLRNARLLTLMRIAASVFTSGVIATPIVLILFEQPIKNFRTDSNEQKSIETITRDKERRAELESRIEEKEVYITQLRSEVEKAYEAYRQEVDKGGQGRGRGRGGIAIALQEAADEKNKRLQEQEPKIHAEIQRSKEEVLGIENKTADLKRVESDIVPNLFALMRLVLQDKSYFIILLGVLGLLMAVDLMPIMIEMQRKPSLYTAQVFRENEVVGQAILRINLVFGETNDSPDPDLKVLLKQEIRKVFGITGPLPEPAIVQKQNDEMILAERTEPDTKAAQVVQLDEAENQMTAKALKGRNAARRLSNFSNEMKKLSEERGLVVSRNADSAIVLPGVRNSKPLRVKVLMTMFQSGKGTAIIIWDRRNTEAAKREKDQIRRRFLSDLHQRVYFISPREIENDKQSLIESIFTFIDRAIKAA